MKIHHIKTVNLNSLYGTYEIDLDVTLEGASLFLIFGPTGSGKSTLMDAVSLALFGVTPRLDAERGKEAADPRAIMSRGAGECSATVVFSKLEAGARRRYRAQWTCWRARRRPDGAWQTPERSLDRLSSDGGWDQLVSSKKNKDYDPAFDEVLEGFGVGDFNRSMLLAQGQFDAFLGAPAEQRAEILERLTGTALYQRLGDRASRMRGRHETRLKALRTLAAAGGGLDPESLAALEAAHGQNERALELRRRERGQSEQNLQWFDTDCELRKNLAKAESEEKQLSEDTAGAAGDLARLAEHERCDGKKAFAALDAHAAARREVAKLAEQLRTIDEALPALRKTAERTTTESTSAAARRTLAAERLEALRPLAADADKTQAERAAAARVAAATAAQTQKARERAAETEKSLADARAAEAEATLQADKARADLAAHAGDEKFVAQWETHKTRLTEHIATSVRLGEEGRGLTESSAAVAQDQGRLAQDRTVHEEGREGVLAPAREAVASSQSALAKLLTRPDFEASRQEAAEAVEAARERWTRVQAAQAPVQAARVGAANLEEARKQIETQAQKLAEAREAEERLENAFRYREKLEAEARAALERTQRIADLVGYRAALVDGEACPLCGSEAHPWVGDPDRADDDAVVKKTVAAAHQAHADARLALEEAKQAHFDAEKARGELGATLKLLQKQNQLSARKQEGLDQAAAAALKAAGLPEDSAADGVVEAIRQARDQLEKRENALKDLDQAQRTVDGAERALRGVTEAHQQAEDDLRATEEQIRERTKRLDQDRSKHTEALERLARERSACRSLLEDLGLTPQGDAPARWREQGDQRRDAHLAHKKAEADCVAHVERTKTVREGLEKLLAERTTQRDEMAQKLSAEQRDRDAKADLATKAREVLDEAWRKILGDDDGRPATDLPPAGAAPAIVLAAQQQWCTQLQAAFEALDAIRQTAQEALAKAQARRDALAGQQGQREKDLTGARAALDAALATLALPDDAALKERRLADDQVTGFRHLKQRLAERQTKVAERIKERRQQVDGHTKTRPEAMPEGPERDDLVQAVETATRAHGEAQAAREETAGRLLAHQQAVQEQEANRRRLAEAEKDARVWLALHDLIGVNDGGRFKQFAQALNLGQLLDRANVHLTRLAKRYRLIPRLDDGGLPTLEFDLSDLWQAGERVAPRSLSGGERFLVSLALALGLSDFRAVKMPIETLLLDEGFGTLDPDTLSVALGALSQLQADGRQVGIISHVVGLRERIEARIEVKPLGGGRSEVRVNG